MNDRGVARLVPMHPKRVLSPRALRTLAIALPVLGAACFLPSVDATGKLCPCPSGYACVAGHCATGDPTSSVDAAVPDAGRTTILWGADLETGDLSQWSNDGLGQANDFDDNGLTDVTTTHAHGGARAMRLAVASPTGSTYNRRWGARGDRLPDDAFYSGWFYFPMVPTSVNLWKIMAWYTRVSPTNTQSILSLGVTVANGAMQLKLSSIIQQGLRWSATPVLPVGDWVHIEVEYRHALDATGSVTVWQNGVQVISASAIQTEIASTEADSRRWGISNYVETMTPSTTDPDARAIFVDDVAIASARVWH